MCQMVNLRQKHAECIVKIKIQKIQLNDLKKTDLKEVIIIPRNNSIHTLVYSVTIIKIN